MCQSSVSSGLIRHNKISSLVLKHSGMVALIPCLCILEMRCAVFLYITVFILIDFWNFYDIIEIC